jgi:hypothetical protein
MNRQDEDFLTEVHRNLDKQAIGPESPLYVHLEELPGDILGKDPIPLLARQVRRATTGSTFYLTGLRGSGKSSHLRRFKQQLERDGYPVLLLDAEDYLNLRRPLEATDLLFFLVGAISDAAVVYDLIEKSDGVESYGWRRLREWLGRFRLAPAIDLALKLPPAEIKVGLRAELRNNPNFVAQLRDAIDGSSLVAQAHAIIEEMVEQMRKRWTRGDWRDLVVIVDSLDHNRADNAGTFLDIRRAMVSLFEQDRSKLELPKCRTIYTLPSLVAAGDGAGTVRRVTNVKIADRDGQTYRPGVDALRDVLAKRVPGGDLKRIFPDDEALTRVVLASGGNLRMLLQITLEVITQAESLPVDHDTVASSIGEMRNSLLPLSEDERERLRRVARTHKLPIDGQECWDPVAELLNRRLVLGYRNGEPWYGVHPLLVDDLGDDPA